MEEEEDTQELEDEEEEDEKEEGPKASLCYMAFSSVVRVV